MDFVIVITSIEDMIEEKDMEIQIPTEFPKDIRETLEADIKTAVASRVSFFRKLLRKKRKC